MGIYKLSVVLQSVSVLMLFFTTIYLFTTWKQKTYSNLFPYSLATLINNIGYLVEMTAKTYTALLIAYMIAVFGIVIHQKLKTRNRDGNIRTILILACALISMAVENRQILETIKEKILKNDVIRSSEKVYKPRVTDLVRRNKKIGTLYILDNITEEYHHAKKIERMALTDAMTEFENRRAYEFKIAELQDNGIPDGTVYISFDVNGLKQVNDRRYNHCL